VPLLAVGIQLVPSGCDHAYPTERANDVVPRSSRIRRSQGTRARPQGQRFFSALRIWRAMVAFIS
jgi:hypothetical protein